MFVNNEQFLTSLFGALSNRAHVTVFHEDPNTLGDQGRLVWAGGHWGNLKGNFTQGGNQYFCISTFNQADDGRARRRKALFAQCNVIVIDDVGYGPSAKVDPNDVRLLEPSYKLETSPGNEQWGYILTTPETNNNKVENLLTGMVRANLCPDGKDPGMIGLTRYVRLPQGTNNKEKYIEILKAPFSCVLNYWNPFSTYTVDQLAHTFNIDLYATTSVEDKELVTDTDHPSFLEFQKHYYVKGALGEGRFDVTCPNVDSHTDSVDNGTAIFLKEDGRLGVKCHHGNCDNYSGSNLMADLYLRNPYLVSQVKAYDSAHMFSPLDGSMLAPAIIDNESQQILDVPYTPELPPVDPNQAAPATPIEILITRFTDRTPSEEIERVMALLIDLTPLKISDHIKKISDMTGRNRVLLNQSLKWVREQIHRSQAFNQPDATLDYPHVYESGMPKATIENLQLMLDYLSITIRYNVMDRNIEFHIPEKEFESDSIRNSQLNMLDSYMEQYGLNSQKSSKYLDTMAQYNKYHPFRDYLDAAGKWDGRDRIKDLAETLKVDSRDVALRDTLLVRWLVSVPAAAFRVVEDTDYDAETFFKSPPPRGIFTLVGPQYMGKTRWLRSVAPNGMFKEGLQLNTDKDGIKQATNKLIVEIGEADASIKGRHAGELKAFISKDMDEVRLPWAKTEVKWPRRTVFGSTVNPSNFLNDATGNTRWWVLKVLKIDFFLLSLIDMKQLWLQVEDLYNKGVPWLLTKEEMDLLNLSNGRFGTVSDLEDWFRDRFDFYDEESAKVRGNWKTTTQVRDLLELNGFKNPRNLRETLIKLTGSENKLVAQYGTTSRLWRLPAPRKPAAPEPEPEQNISGFTPI